MGVTKTMQNGEKKAICYICRKKINYSHSSYTRMCKECGEFNLNKRDKIWNLTGYTVLITGGRIKIGFYTALRLLRDGAKVIITTRFPMDAIKRFSSESDYLIWKSNLTICYVDLKRVDLLDEFIEWIYENFTSIDILINNAAQTVRYPQSHYIQLENNEKEIMRLLPYEDIKLLLGYKNIENEKYDIHGNLYPINKPAINLDSIENHNSWVAKSEEISTVEFLEVQLINVTSPFLLTSRLKNILKRSKNKNRFIINVTSIEGMFSQKKKSSYHVHTNMAKSSLNMLTKTLSRDYAKDRIFVFSVDPGWVSNQFPEKWQGLCDGDFVTPLNYFDAAARICDPIYTEKDSDLLKAFGVLMKDYKVSEW